MVQYIQMTIFGKIYDIPLGIVYTIFRQTYTMILRLLHMFMGPWRSK